MEISKSINLFDTLEYTKRAIGAGFSPQQAEFQAREMASLLSETVVTRTILRQELIDLETRMRNFQYRIARTALASTATAVAVLQTVFHFFSGQ